MEYRVEELAASAGVRVDTVRFYQGRGLLPAPRREGRVAFYQSGFNYEDDNRLKPGLVTHALVVQSCIEQGYDVYDFLAGGPAGERYKESLSTDASRLAWCVIRRPTIRNRVVSWLRSLKRRLITVR